MTEILSIKPQWHGTLANPIPSEEFSVQAGDSMVLTENTVLTQYSSTNREYGID